MSSVAAFRLLGRPSEGIQSGAESEPTGNQFNQIDPSAKELEAAPESKKGRPLDLPLIAALIQKPSSATR